MSLAKNFEKLVLDGINELKDCYCLRLYDTMYINARNPSDFVAYKKPNMILLECKTTAGTSLPFKNISDGQWEDISNATKQAKGIVGLILVWFYDKDVTLAINIKELIKMREAGKKSIRFDTVGDGMIVVDGKKSHKYFKYDFNKMMNEVKQWK